MNDNGHKIKVEIKTTPVRLDKRTKLSNDRIILGYFVMDYNFDEDATVTLYYRRDDTMNYSNTEPIIVKKGNKRIVRKLPLDIGDVIDYYVKIAGEFKTFIITSAKLLIKTVPIGRHGVTNAT